MYPTNEEHFTNTVEQWLENWDAAHFNVMDESEVEIGKWEDSNPLNFSNTMEDEFNRLFSKDIQ